MALLTAHLIEGQPVGLVVKNYSLIKVPFKIEDEISPGYTDISSISNWYELGTNLNRDYLFVRKEIKKLCDLKAIESCDEVRSNPPSMPSQGDRYYIDPAGTATGSWEGYEGFIAEWESLSPRWVIEPTDHVGYRISSTDEKNILSKYKIGSVIEHYAELGVPSVVDIGEEYHRNAIEARKARMLRCTVEVYNRLTNNYSTVLQNLTGSAVLGNMIYNYEQWGLKGIIEDYNKDFNPTPTPGCIDYLMSRSPFDGLQANIDAGFPQGMRTQAWTTVDGLNMVQFSDELYDILVNGIYN